MLELYIEYTIARIGRTMDCRAARRVENNVRSVACLRRTVMVASIHPVVVV